ncbi:MAG: helix-turn-helix domain-containing protein [Paraglaciecola sp.]|uniref:helix-turn-helix domain-containing protein n=1 Tax=Paraglaciecola sp. TaxID=1920173 RepID=UPI0032969C35
MVGKIHPLSFDPSRPDFSPYGLTCVHWKPSPMPRPDHHSEVELNFLKSGSVTYLLGGKKTVVEVGKLSAFWAAIPHQIIDFTPDTVYLVATIPLHDFLNWQLPEYFVEQLMHGRFLSDISSDRSQSDGRLFEHWVEDLQAPTSVIEKVVLLEMQARLTRMAYNLTDENKGECFTSIAQSGLNKVEQMACYVAQNYTDKLTAAQISKFVDLHPNYAMSLFQKTYGTTLNNYLTQHRISHAQRLLTTTDLKITDIAVQSGFLTISRFNEAFVRACGCSPRDYRKSHKMTEGSRKRRA